MADPKAGLRLHENSPNHKEKNTRISIITVEMVTAPYIKKQTPF